MNIFQKLAVPRVHFSNFNMSHSYKCGMNMGYLVPIGVYDVLPNDTWHLSTSAFIRLASMKFPLMDNLNCKIYHFFVPNRILWSKWQKFISEDVDENLPEVPYVTLGDLKATGNLAINTLCDYMGLPVNNNIPDTSIENVSILPFLAYQKVWNDYFRDQNLQEDIFSQDNPSLYEFMEGKEGKVAINDTATDYFAEFLFSLRKKAWEKDYFTSALPDPQLGEPVPVPVNVKVSGNISLYDTDLYFDINKTNAVRLSQNVPVEGAENLNVELTNNDKEGPLKAASYNVSNILPSSISGKLDKNSNLTGTGSFNLNDLRVASAIQRFRELLSRAGHRYKETILSIFNQVTPDYRLDRPQFLGSTNIPVQISDIPQTSQTTTGSADASPLGTLAGRGTVAGGQQTCSFHAPEHGYVISLACVVPRTSYMNGLDRKFSRLDRYDYFFPQFEELGEQAILKKEIFATGDNDTDNDVFGYAPRYSEYKYIPSTVHGDFTKSMDFMTMVRKFQSAPNLNGDFVTPDDELCRRPFAVQQEGLSNLYCMFQNNVLARRPMQKLPVPKLF